MRRIDAGKFHVRLGRQLVYERGDEDSVAVILVDETVPVDFVVHGSTNRVQVGGLGLVGGRVDDEHACIATLGAELFKREATGDLNERVTRAVTEQLVLDRTPLTREERRQIIREITDDILGYGPLEPLMRDDSVTEVMVNAYDQIYVERLGKLELVAASTRRRRWSTLACRTALV